MANELLYDTNYVSLPSPTPASDSSKQEDRDSFRRFWEQSKGLPGLKAGSTKRIIEDTNIDDTDKKPGVSIQQKNFRDDQKARPSAYQRSKIVCIDSKDRDQKTYPDPACFRIYFGEQFANVCRIQLLDTQLPNTEQLIRSQPTNKRNDTISWVNGPEEEDYGQIYSITITPGNYTPDTFANEIVTKTAAVARNLPSTSEKVYHSFDVAVNGITNTFLMRQNRSSTIANPFSTQAGSPVVTVNQTSHGFFTGQIVNLSGCSSFAGLSPDILNAAQVITVNTEKVDSLSSNADSSTSILHGTTSKIFSGRVCVKKNTNVVIGRGTSFLSEISSGDVVNIGYFNYTVDRIIDDTKLSVEEALIETFDEYTLIKDLSNSNQGMAAYAADPSMTQVKCLKTRVRDIGADTTAAKLEAQYILAVQIAASYSDKDITDAAVKARRARDIAASAFATASTILANDSAYQSSIGDLSLSIYNKIQKTIIISDLAKSFRLKSTFASRDSPAVLQSSPAMSYKTFNTFYLKDSIENFNIEQVTSTNSATFSVSAGSQSSANATQITLPVGTTGTIGFILVLKNALPGWNIQFDRTSRFFYFSPPLSGATTVTGGIYNYTCRTQSQLQFSEVSANASTLMGLPTGTSILGNVVVSSTLVVGNNQVVLAFASLLHIFDGSLQLLCELKIDSQTFTNISQLISLLNSILIARAVPIAFSYSAGMQAVVVTASSALPTFQIAFPQQAAGGLATALGFEFDRIYQNLTIKSQFSVNNVLREGYYTHRFLDDINAVGIYKSRQARGTASITNTSNVVIGNPDTFAGITVGSFGTTTSVKGQISSSTWQLVDTPIGVTTVSDLSYFQNATTSAQSLQAFEVSSQCVDVYVVQLLQSRFSFIRSADGRQFSDSDIVYELGRTICFDLRSLDPKYNIFKLSQYQNGSWSLNPEIKTSAELLQYTRYMMNGQFLQLYIPKGSVLPSPYLYVYDELSEDTIDSNPTVIPTGANLSPFISTIYFYLRKSNSQLLVSQVKTDNLDTLPETPVIEMIIGHIYVLDFAAIAESVNDTLQLSTSIDGPHFNGGPTLNSNQFLTVGASTITLNLSAEKGPFPTRIFYLLQNQAGAGGDGHIQISFPEHSGVIKIQSAGRSKFNLFRGGPIISVSTDPGLVQTGNSLIYSPFVDSISLPSTSSINLVNSSNNITSTTVVGPVSNNITLDNNRFIVTDILLKQEVTITIPTGIYQINQLSGCVANNINSAFNITDPSSQWTLVFDNASSKFTFVIQNNRQYSFRFSGFDSKATDLYNSAAELLGFARSETPSNQSNGSSNIVSSTAVKLSEIAGHVFCVSTANLSGALQAWSEALIDSSNSEPQPVVCRPFFSRFSGSRFSYDFAINDTVLLGTDYDQTFTVVGIVNDYQLTLSSNVAIIKGGVDATTGLSTPPPRTTYNVKLFNVTNIDVNSFSTNDELFFNRSLVARSTFDYDGRLAGKEFLLNRISPIKLTIPETDILLSLSESDPQKIYNFPSINNHDLFYVTNNSRYQFSLGIPATSTVSNKGGNPISVGTGVKYKLLFSQTNTPGNILGFPNVGIPAQGDTKFMTVQSNTLPDASTSVNISRSVPGTGNFAGSLQILTTTTHNFQFGDTVYITNHMGSSNDVAINSDEGYTINLDPAGSTYTETVNGVDYVRGYFYIPLNVSRGGVGGEAFRRKLYRPFALAGDNYVYLTCPLLASLNSTSSNVQNIFAKIALNSPPGSIIFNSFTSTEKVFDDGPVALLDHLDFTVVDGQGELFLFNNTDWSCSIKITVSSCTLPSTGISSRTNLYSENAAGNATSTLQTHA